MGKVKTMKFEEMISHLIYGRKVRRTIWPENLWLESNGDSTYLRTMAGNKVLNAMLYTSNDRIFTLDDVCADDWTILEK